MMIFAGGPTSSFTADTVSWWHIRRPIRATKNRPARTCCRGWFRSAANGAMHYCCAVQVLYPLMGSFKTITLQAAKHWKKLNYSKGEYSLTNWRYLEKVLQRKWYNYVYCKKCIFVHYLIMIIVAKCTQNTSWITCSSLITNTVV